MFSSTSGPTITCNIWVLARVATRVCTWKLALRRRRRLDDAMVDDGITCSRLRSVDLGPLDGRIKFHDACHWEGAGWKCVEALCSLEISRSTAIDPVRLR